MVKRIWLRIAITARQNRAALAFTAAWLLANALVFGGALGLPWKEAAAVALCLHKTEGAWGRLYASFTEFVVLGATASLIVAADTLAGEGAFRELGVDAGAAARATRVAARA